MYIKKEDKKVIRQKKCRNGGKSRKTGRKKESRHREKRAV
jgi:hypothetical protein